MPDYHVKPFEMPAYVIERVMKKRGAATWVTSFRAASSRCLRLVGR
jgi:hypothetical protein